jgi:hypothetical protein
MDPSAHIWRTSLLGKKENVVQKPGGAEPLPKHSLDLSLTSPAVLANSQLRMLVLDLRQCFVTLVRKSAALDHLSMNREYLQEKRRAAWGSGPGGGRVMPSWYHAGDRLRRPSPTSRIQSSGGTP